MHRSRTARLAVAALGLSIVTSMLAVIPAFAGDTRSIHIGSPNAAGNIPVGGDGLLTTTSVSAGESFLVSVRVFNDGPQNINNVQLQIGLDGAPTVDESYPVPPSTTAPAFPVPFDDDTTVDDIVVGDDKCTTDSDGPVVCTVGTLGKRKGFTATLLITTDEDLTELPLKATVKVSENANDNGANLDTFAAEANIPVDARDCTGIFGYLPAGQAKQIDTTDYLGSDCEQAIDLFVDEGQTNQNAVIFAELVDEAEDDSTTNCVAGQTCFGDTFSISVNGGVEVEDYFEVTIVWTDLPDWFNINKAGVVHDGALINATKKDECSTKKLVNCWFFSDVEGDAWTFSIRLEENGFIRGKG